MSTLITPVDFPAARRAFIIDFYAASDEKETIDKVNKLAQTRRCVR